MQAYKRYSTCEDNRKAETRSIDLEIEKVTIGTSKRTMLILNSRINSEKFNIDKVTISGSYVHDVCR
jgi:hypothetical protein